MCLYKKFSVYKKKLIMHSIVYSLSAGETEKFAAQELQKYIHLTTGAFLPAVKESEFIGSEENSAIYVGRTRAAENFGERTAAVSGDGYSIFTFGGNVYIYSESARGALYGVYFYLYEGYGIRFLNIGEEYVPRSDYYIPHVDKTVNPAFKYQGNLTDVTYHTHEGLYSEEMPVYYAKINATHEFIYLNQTTDSGKTDKFFETLEKVGGGIELDVSINPTHNNLVYVDPAIYFTDENKQENRHMFCFGSSKQYDENGPVSDINYADGIKADGTIDHSTVNAASVYVESLKNQILSNPGKKYYNCGQQDITYCHPDCGSTDEQTSYTVLRFYNAVAKEIKAWAESRTDVADDIKLVIFSYYFTKAAPVREENGKYVPIDGSVVLSDNMAIRFADIVSNQYYSLVDPNNTVFGYGPDYFEKWAPVINNCEIWYWGYTTNHTFYYFYLPTIQKIKPTLTALEEAGATYVMLQGNTTEDKDWKGIMDNYVYSKMLTDPSLDPYKLRDEFTESYYGTAAEYIKEAVNLLDQTVASLNGKLYFNGNPNAYWANIYRLYPNSHITGDVVTSLLDTEYEMAKACERVLELTDMALAAVNSSALSEKDKADLTRRVELVRMTPLFTLCYYKEYLYGDNGFTTSYYQSNAEAINAVTEEFFEICDRYGIKEYGERLKIYGTAANTAETWFGYNK